MDDLQLLNKTRNTASTPTDAILARGKSRLLARIHEEETPAVTPLSHRTLRRPVRGFNRALLASAATALIVAGVVAADVIGPEATPGATAEAADVLREAASLSLTSADPVLAPGQYLRTDMDAAYTSTLAISADGEQVTWLTSQDGQLYVPADQSGDWVWNREARVPVKFFNDADRKVAALVLDNGIETPADTLTAPGGAFYNTEQLFLGMPLAEAIRTAPRDPQEMLELIIERTPETEGSTAESAFNAIADFLRAGVVPAELRSTLYEAAILLDGVTLVDEQATMDGRTGTAIGVESANGAGRQDIIIDPATGLMIGERTTRLKAAGDIPAGTMTSWTAITTTVVDTLPPL
jgi:RNA polymerase sigma-70 factor (ECF subfamily)